MILLPAHRPCALLLLLPFFLISSFACIDSLPIPIGRNVKGETPSEIQLMLHNKERMLAKLTEDAEVKESTLKDKATKHLKSIGLKESASLVQMMQDQIKSAKRLTSFARINNRHRLLRDLKSQIQENEQTLGHSLVDADLPKSASEKIKNMGRILAKARDQQSKCEAMVKKLKSLLLANEAEVQGLKEEGTFLGTLAARTVPKGLHCLALRLTIQYYNISKSVLVPVDEWKVEDPQLYHYAIFTDNVLAASVIVNSTAFYAEEPHKHVFHILTDSLNYAAMKMWFLANKPGNVVVEVKNLDKASFQHVVSPVLRKLERKHSKPDLLKPRSFVSLNMRRESLESVSKFDHLLFYLPEIFPNLDKILVLDDDVVLQKDLTDLWRENLHGKVSGAVKSCGSSNRHLDHLLELLTEMIPDRYDSNSWVWQYCINIFDLEEWRRQNLTDIYHKGLLLNQVESLWKLGSLSPNLATFYNTTHTFGNLWHVLNVDDTSDIKQDLQNSVAIHYSGYAKPWLEMGMNRYRSSWTRFVNYDSPLLQECNINK